eukprot:GFKZ01009146.1.p1 GENE.GFKZ01009146.1~~GFKZ01009146.1.p1  ORF type:complete len:105 (-),score=0.94 GFKZ01009146.1:153-467(-)
MAAVDWNSASNPRLPSVVVCPIKYRVVSVPNENLFSTALIIVLFSVLFSTGDRTGSRPARFWCGLSSRLNPSVSSLSRHFLKRSAVICSERCLFGSFSNSVSLA